MENKIQRCRIVYRSAVLIIAMSLCISAAPQIASVTASSTQVGKYAKIEFVVGITGTYTNPYDPDQIDLSATFTSPSGKTWKINGFYGTDAANTGEWKIRFAPDEIGAWTYIVKAIDPTGTTQEPAGNFTCVTSTNHGWIRIAANNRYLRLDDGTSFYGIGPCYPYNVTFPGFELLKGYGCNTFVYWNGPNDGYGLIESTTSGIGKYDQPKCRRVDSLLDSSEAQGLHMFMVIWPHDQLGQSMPGTWTNHWSTTPYSTIVSQAVNFYGDSTAWKYEQKMYRYIIARYSYHQSLGGWQTIDEIEGTDGWKNQVTANAWTTKMADFFRTNDPFKHPTNASGGSYWPHGDSVNDFSNTENYGSTAATNWASIIQKLWNNYLKPAIVGESTNKDAHINLWSTLSTGIAITPLMWQFNAKSTVWSPTISANWPPVAAFVAGINFAGLTNLTQAKVTLTGATAYGITGDQVTFGWITGTISGKNMVVTGLTNGSRSVEWWDCTAGTRLSTAAVTVSGGTLTTAVPTTTQADLAFKIISPTGVVAKSGSLAMENNKQAIVYNHGVLRLLEPLAKGAVITISTLQGRTIAHYAAGFRTNTLVVKIMEPGIYFAKIRTANGVLRQRLVVSGS